MIAQGRIFGITLLSIMTVIIYFNIRRAIKGKIPKIRLLPAIEAIEEGVGRAAEMGRPVHFSPGFGKLQSAYGTETISGMSVLHQTARFAARKRTDIICTIGRSPHQPIAEEAIRTAFLLEGLFVMEVMRKVGAINIGGTTRLYMTPYFVGGCDYSLLGEEVLAAGAYITKDPASCGGFLGQDYCKYIMILLIVLGVITTSFGTDIIANILGL